MSAESKRQAILQMVGKLAEEEAEMPGPDGPVKVIVRELTGQQSQAFEEATRLKRPNTLGMLLQMVIHDTEDAKDTIFGPADRAVLEELGMTTLKPIVEIAMRQSGLRQEDVERAKQDLAKTPENA